MQCVRGVGNAKDRYAISVLQGSNVVDTYLKRFLELTKAFTGISHNTFLLHLKYFTGLITVKESNHENKVHVVKTRYMVYCNHSLIFQGIVFHKKGVWHP